MALREHVQHWMRVLLKPFEPKKPRLPVSAPVEPATSGDSVTGVDGAPNAVAPEPSLELTALVGELTKRLGEAEQSGNSALDRTHEKAKGLRNRYFGLMDAINTPSVRRTEDGDQYLGFDAEDAEPREWYDADERQGEVIYAELLLFLDQHRELQQRDEWRLYYKEIGQPEMRPKIEEAAKRQDQIGRGAEVAGNDRVERFAQRNDRSYLDRLPRGVAGTEGYGDELRSAFYREEYGLEPLSPQAREAVLASDEPPF